MFNSILLTPTPAQRKLLLTFFYDPQFNDLVFFDTIDQRQFKMRYDQQVAKKFNQSYDVSHQEKPYKLFETSLSGQENKAWYLDDFITALSLGHVICLSHDDFAQKLVSQLYDASLFEQKIIPASLKAIRQLLPTQNSPHIQCLARLALFES